MQHILKLRKCHKNIRPPSQPPAHCFSYSVVAVRAPRITPNSRINRSPGQRTHPCKCERCRSQENDGLAGVAAAVHDRVACKRGWDGGASTASCHPTTTDMGVREMQDPRPPASMKRGSTRTKPSPLAK